MTFIGLLTQQRLGERHRQLKLADSFRAFE
jgi:hypothetical protein